jgi:hypothetical protein
MHFCSNCHRAVLDEVPYCPSCGAAQIKGVDSTEPAPPSSAEVSRPNPVNSPPPFPTPPATSYSISTDSQQQQTFSQRNRKSPATSAILNFFLPGMGYIYNGIGVDSSQLVFGILCFLALFLGIFVPSVIDALFVSTSTSTTQGFLPIDYLSIFVFLIPFALAYDGYRRAVKINERSGS